MKVRLAPHDMMVAAMMGVMRNVSAKVRGLPDRHGADGDGWGMHIEGAMGEMAAAKAMDRFWTPTCDTFRSRADIGNGVEVRTRSQHDYELIVRQDDKDAAVFVLVTGRSPDFLVRGWIYGRDAKRQQWLKTHGGRPAAYFVPTDALHPIDEIRAASAA